MKNEFYDDYKTRVIPALQEQQGYKNVHQIPKVEKVVINTSVGSQADVKQALEDAKAELALISGQKPAETRAKKSIANFKLRQEQAIGAKVTLRGAHMYEFLERLIKTALPRIRDFRGVSPKAFDGNGNYTLGVPDQAIFPRSSSTKSSATSVLMLPSSPPRGRTRKRRRSSTRWACHLVTARRNPPQPLRLNP
jgi:large subunit ribosomal protein L5